MSVERGRRPGTVMALPVAIGNNWRIDEGVDDEGVDGYLEVQYFNRSTARWEVRFRFVPGVGLVVL